MLSRYVPAMLSSGEGVRTAVTDDWVATYRFSLGSLLPEMFAMARMGARGEFWWSGLGEEGGVAVVGREKRRW